MIKINFISLHINQQVWEKEQVMKKALFKKKSVNIYKI